MATGAAPGYGSENQPPEWRQNLNTHLICPDCKQVPPDLIEENAETICNNCGMVLADRLVSYDSEWRTFNSDEGKGDDPNRVGDAENELLNGNQLATTIGGRGAGVSKETRKLQITQSKQLENKANKALTNAYDQIDTWASRANLNTAVRNAAKAYYKQTDDAKVMKGKSLEVILAGCLFIACRQCKTPRTFTEIFGLTSVPKKEIGRVYKSLERFLMRSSNDKNDAIENEGGIIDRERMQFQGSLSTKPRDLCARYCDMIGLDFRVQSISQGLSDKMAQFENVAGRSPLSTASACIYFASHLIGRGATLKKISEVAHVSEATIKHAYRYMYQDREKLVEPGWLGEQGPPFGGFGALKNLPGS